jgi:hypothetical protein
MDTGTSSESAQPERDSVHKRIEEVAGEVSDLAATLEKIDRKLMEAAGDDSASCDGFGDRQR